MAHCSALCSLRIKHLPSQYTYIHIAHPQDPLYALCAVLERHPPPLPALEHFSLQARVREEQMVSPAPALCARLADNLLDATRYPHFALLTIRAGLQKWQANYWSIFWEPSARERAERDAMLGRVCAAFAAFERAPGVVLDVDSLTLQQWVSSREPSREDDASDGISENGTGWTTWPESAHRARTICCMRRPASRCLVM